ncbi:MAG: 23S rRNA (pseudouridine(1915)-N(3))-methyltransferase RlmH [Lachnospiraceae bacterium]|nr:23S rRNA (pseudouridine(1915)-N(3))-methyltransferase RlmH [Lachnospiraceae bacterium]
MRTVTVVCVGKLKERFWREAAEEYEKRLSAYCDLRIAEVADEKAPERLSGADLARVRAREGERILKQVPAGAFCMALAIEGKRYDSVRFADRVRAIQETGDGKIAFVIGGSVGLSDAVYARADETVSFSDMTLPHQLARVVLLEQLYRGYRIRNGEPYHK